MNPGLVLGTWEHSLGVDADWRQVESLKGQLVDLDLWLDLVPSCFVVFWDSVGQQLAIFGD